MSSTAPRSESQARKVNPGELSLWRDPEAMATPLLFLIVDRLGVESFDYDPQSLLIEIEDEWGVKPHPAAFDRLMAGIAITTGDEFFVELPTFVDFCNLLSGGLFDPRWFDPADTFEICWGLLEASLLNPPEEGELRSRLSEDVIGYIEQTTKWEGFIRLPEVLRGIVTRSQDLPDTDDPVVFETIFQVQEEKKQEVETWVSQRFAKMGDQLKKIKFQNGQTEVIARLIQKLT